MPRLQIPHIGKKTKKSVNLTTTEWEILQELQGLSKSDTVLAQYLGIDRVTLLRILSIGSGSQANINKIRRKLSKLQTAA